METAPDKTSRTQEERTFATRARLVEATLDLLLAKGYAGTTTVDIAARAGLTRGALAHHYAGKDELVVEAFDRHLTIVTQEIRTYATLVRDGSLSLDDFIDRVWTIFSGRFFMLTLEEVTAARHNDFLRIRLVSRTRDFHDSLDAIWRQFFDETGLNPLEIEVMLNATLCLLRFWKSILKEQIKAATKAAADSKGKAE